MEQVTFKNTTQNTRLANTFAKSKIKAGFKCTVKTEEDSIVIQWCEKKEATPATSVKDMVFNALLSNVENNNSVYLLNAYSAVSSIITPSQWSGYLSALTKEGKYQPLDSYFGTVII